MNLEKEVSAILKTRSKTAIASRAENWESIADFLKDAPIFLQPWWLEAVAPGRVRWAVIQKGRDIAAIMPYVYRQRAGIATVESPSKTPYLGPWMRPSSAKYAKRLAEEKDLYQALVAQLPPHARFDMCFHPGVTNWLPFYWHGFQQSTKYTYRIFPFSSIEEVWSETLENIRRNIRKARKTLHLDPNDDVEILLRLHKMTCERQGIVFPHTDEEIFRIHEACQKQKVGKIFVARDEHSRIHAAGWFLWDNDWVYYYMSGADPSLRTSGAGSLIVWRGIELAHEMGKGFDFEGSMVEPIERFFRAFGARQVPYFHLKRTPQPFRWGLLHSLIRLRLLIKRAP